MSPYTYLLFDLDGTISESAPGIIKAVKYGLAAVGIDEENEENLHSFIGPPLNVQMKKLYQMSEENIKIAVTKFRELYESGGIFDCTPYEGMGDLLQDCQKAGYVVAVASSKPEPFVKRIIEKFGFTDSFTVICGSDIGDELNKRANPNQKARIIRKALSELEAKGYDRKELEAKTVMIGDTAYDADGANETHLPCIGVTYGYGTREELERQGAAYIVDTVQELRELLLTK